MKEIADLYVPPPHTHTLIQMLVIGKKVKDWCLNKFCHNEHFQHTPVSIIFELKHYNVPKFIQPENCTDK